ADFVGLRAVLLACRPIRAGGAALQSCARRHQPRHAAADGVLRRRARPDAGRAGVAGAGLAHSPDRLACRDGGGACRSARGLTMAGEEDEAEKEYDPSERKLARAREDGDVARSEDLQASASLAGLVLALMLAGAWAVASAGQAGMVFLDQPDRLAGMPGGTTTLTLRMTAPFAVLLLLPAGAV